MDSSTVNAENTDELLLNIARLAYRLGRQDQQRYVESALRKTLLQADLADKLRALATEFPHEPVSLLAIVLAAQEHSTAVNSASEEAR